MNAQEQACRIFSYAAVQSLGHGAAAAGLRCLNLNC